MPFFPEKDMADPVEDPERSNGGGQCRAIHLQGTISFPKVSGSSCPGVRIPFPFFVMFLVVFVHHCSTAVWSSNKGFG